MTPASSIVIGAVGGVVVVYGALLLEKIKVDDPVSAVPVHLLNGVWGTLAVGLFATDNGLFTTGQAGQLLAQAVGVLSVGAWCAVTGAALFAAIKALNGLRVSQAEEVEGLDMHEHGSLAYPDDVLAGLGGAARVGSLAEASTD